MIALQAAWLALLGCYLLGLVPLHPVGRGDAHSASGEPDLVGYSIWAIFLTLGFFTAWALVSWALSIAPLLMLLEERSALSALGEVSGWERRSPASWSRSTW